MCKHKCAYVLASFVALVHSLMVEVRKAVKMPLKSIYNEVRVVSELILKGGRPVPQEEPPHCTSFGCGVMQCKNNLMCRVRDY